MGSQATSTNGIKIQQSDLDPFPFYSSSDISNVKKDLNVDQGKLKEAFERLEKVLDSELPKLSLDVIPVVNFHDLSENGNQFDDETVEKIKKRGVVIIRNVIDKDEAQNMHDDLVDYMTKNGKNPLIKDQKMPFYDIYWSKTQIKARHHANMIKVQNALLNLWNTSEDFDESVNLNQPLTYNDRLRFRKPKTTHKLGPHWDSGNLNRWADSTYQKSHQAIFDGNWENFDPFCVNGRGSTNVDDHCSFFRAFQGWTSLTNSGPGNGTLRVLPLLKESTAHVMMRPLLDDIPETMIPGYKPKSFCQYHLVPQIHSKLMDAMISIPQVNPGDTVWWHCDLIHSVEEFHHGEETNAVVYIPVGPDCPINRAYIEKAKKCFLEGKSPPDFPSSDLEINFQGRATNEDLNEDANFMMGFENKS